MKKFILNEIQQFKLNKYCYFLILFLGFFCIFIFKILKIFINININLIDGSRIGHFVPQSGIILELVKLNKDSNYYFFVSQPSNDFLFEFLKKKLNISNNIIILSIIISKNFLSNIGINICTSNININKKLKFIDWNIIKPNTIYFSKEEKKLAEKILIDKFNILPNERYVCLIVRDHVYLNDKHSEHKFRNFDIDSFNLAVRKLNKLGYKVIRMGKRVYKKISFKNSKYIDYANSKYRSDFLDFYLIKNCSFMISNVTGPDNIAQIFHKPICLIVMALNFVYPFKNKNIILPRTIINNKKNFLSLSEIIKKKLTSTNKTSDYNKLKVLPQYPKAKDLKNLALEMHLKINNKLKINREKQNKYWELFFKNSDKKDMHVNRIKKNFKSQICNYYLIKNSKWFLK